MLEQLCVPSGFEARKYAPLTIPPEVQARYDALTDVQKTALRLEMETMFGALYAGLGASRSNA